MTICISVSLYGIQNNKRVFEKRLQKTKSLTKLQLCSGKTSIWMATRFKSAQPHYTQREIFNWKPSFTQLELSKNCNTS